MQFLEMHNITKRFPGVVALDNVDLNISPGEVLTIVGENGAGKSTLIKILSGAYQQDEGTITIEGRNVGKLTTKKSLEAGIAVIYQELSYMPYMTVAENIFIGRLPEKHGIIDYKTLKRKSRKIQQETGLGHLDPFTKVSELSTSEKQLLEIARAYAKDMKILILDEPTSSLNEEETDRLFSLIRKLQKEKKAVIFISHKLDEIFEIGTTVQIMRDGKVVKHCPVGALAKQEIIKYMVGRTLHEMYPIHAHAIGDVVFSAKAVKTSRLKNISFNVRSGEILGLYGLMGSGCPEVLECIFGARRIDSGSFYLNNTEIHIRNPKDATQHGFAYIPSERKTEGIMLNQSVESNILAVTMPKYRKGPILNIPKLSKVARNWVKTLQIKTPSVATEIVSLSGGNQQKVILAKWLDNDPSLFLMNEPTRGIDVGAKVEIYRQMEQLCTEKRSIIMVTTDLPELLAVSDRVYVFFEGKITAEFSKTAMTQEEIVKKAIGE
jgi:ABC-type sugar transport system ATPase subunit